jgi:cytokinin dehydrogenase
VTSPAAPTFGPDAFDRLAADPRFDFGRLERGTPAMVVRPETIDQLAGALRELATRRVPYKLRGAAHTAGGQVLIDGGAVVDLTGLDRIVADDPAGETITIEGGATWLAVAEHLHRQGRRPLALTDHLRTTVAGTLSVGGFCDSSHRHGLQLATVTALTLVTPDGGRHRLGPGDELFRFALGGLGQLGAIAEATIRTERRPPILAARLLRWYRVADYVRDAQIIVADGLYDFVRARLVWPDGGTRAHVDATVGDFVDAVPERAPVPAALRPSLASNLEAVDLMAELRADLLAGWTWSTAAVEVVLPLPGGARLWPELEAAIVAAGIPAHLRRGAGTTVVPCRPRLPLAPLPRSPTGWMIALRPRAARDQAVALLPALRALADRALAAGGAIYRVGAERLTRDQLATQHGDALDRLLALKAALDPDDLCNPGLLG